MDDATQPDPDPEPRRSRGAAPVRPVLVEITDPDRLLTPDALAWLRRHAALAGDELARRFGVRGEARVRVVGDAEMRRLHADHSGDDTTTDVLTFDLEPGDDRLLDADVYVCAPEAERQGAGRGLAPERELLLYTLHAMLHGAGFDDHDDADFARMHATEDEILGAIGVGATFAGPGAAGGGR